MCVDAATRKNAMHYLVRRFALVTAVAAFVTAFSSWPPARAETLKITVTIPDKGASIRACAQALVATSGILKAQGLDATVKILASSQGEASVDEVSIDLDPRGELLDLLSVPFAFRDAAHFQAYLQSDLYREIRGRISGDRIGLAYGGFLQIFSRDVAVTEPKHFYKRWIGGQVSAWNTYDEYGAYRRITSIATYFATNFSPEPDARRMAEGDRTVNMVEALLGSAIENNLHRHARFVNLVSSAVMPVHMKLKGPDDLWKPHKSKLLAWGQEASAKCSAQNYQAELDTLERLKAAGVTVVPFNRAAMVQTSWRQALEKEHSYWTISEFDRLVQLGGDTKGVPLPSQIVDKMPAAKKKKALAYNVEPSRQRQREMKNLRADIERERVRSIALTARLGFKAQLEKMTPPEFVPWKPIVIAPSSPAYARIKESLVALEDALKACGPCKFQPVATGWIHAAIVNAALGDRDGALAAYTRVTTDPRRTAGDGYDNRIRRAAIAVKHPDAEAIVEKYLAGMRSIDEIVAASKSTSKYKVEYATSDRFSALCDGAVLLIELGLPERARALLAEASTLSVPHGSAYLMLASAYWYAGDPKAAWANIANAMQAQIPVGARWPLLTWPRASVVRPLNEALAEPTLDYLDRLSAQLRAVNETETPSYDGDWRVVIEGASDIAAHLKKSAVIERYLDLARQDAAIEKVDYRKGNARWRVEKLQGLLKPPQPAGPPDRNVDPEARVWGWLATLEAVTGIDRLE